MHLKMPERELNLFESDLNTSTVFTDNESEVEKFKTVDKVIIENVTFGSALQLQSNVYKVDAAAIIKAPVMAVNTEAGFTIEVITDTGAEVSIISDRIVKAVGLRIVRTVSGANQVDKMPLNVLGMITIPVTHGQFSWVFNALVCSGVGDVCIGGNPFLCQGITPLPSKRCILLESNQDSVKIPWRPELVDKSCQNFANVGLLRTEENSTIFPGDFLKIKAPPTIAMLGDVKVFISPRNSKPR